MRIMIDLDGTIAELRKEGQTYEDVRINPGALAKLRALKKAGHYIIIQTARHMKTCGGDQGKVVAKVGKQTLDWLAKHRIPYDEIYFGKPYADLYIDDLAHTFTNWDAITVSNLDETRLNILVPMAGAGSRFAQAGYTDPKPLISARSKTLIEWSMESFAFLKDQAHVSFIFIILKEHDTQYQLRKKLKAMFGKQATVLMLDAVTDGQAATCLTAKRFIGNHQQLIIYNCDTYTTGNEKLLDLIEAERPDGVLACFQSKHPRYSYAHLDQYGYVDATAEKQVISNLASTGLYYFRRGIDFVNAAEDQASRPTGTEQYVAPCYNTLLAAGKKVKTYLVEDNWVLGTPEELAQFEKKFRKKGTRVT